MLSLNRSSRRASPLKNLYGFYFSATATTTDRQGEVIPSRNSPPPIQVLLTESAGRGVFATRRIGAGELIHTAKPVVAHPTLSSIHAVCYFCLRKLQKRAIASQAQDVSFCSEQCREQAKAFYEIEKRSDWSAFNDHCRTRGLKYPLLVKRLACMVLSGVASANTLDILQPMILSSKMVLLMEEEFGLLRSAFKSTAITDEQMAFLTKQWYVGVLARIRINAFRIDLATTGGSSYEDLLSSAAASVEAESAVGNAVYMLPCFYNHDCDPNAHILWIENAEAKLKALRDIESGEEMRICYIDTSMSRDARQTVLSQGFGFQCHCQRCLSND